MENAKILKTSLLLLLIAALATTSAFADYWALTPVDPVPTPSFIGTGQFGSLLVGGGPVSVDFEAPGAFSGTLTAAAYGNATNVTFVYRIEMDPTPEGASIDKFRLATVFPPDLAIDEITAVGYNNYYATLDPNTAPALCWTGVDGIFTVIDFDYKDSPGDETGLLAGTISEVFIQTSMDVAVEDVYGIFINAGSDVELTIGGVVSPGPPPLVPEPGTIGMMVAGILGAAGIIWNRLR
ncbi:MAG: PEP-CTERM sorting domain-containing protein [Planctomycetota bacterium]